MDRRSHKQVTAGRGCSSRGIIGSYFARNEGATAVEFALIAPLLVLLTMMWFEIGIAMWMQQALENATRQAARLIRTGSAQTSGSSATFYAALCAKTPLFTCSNIKFSVTSATAFSSLSSTVTTNSSNQMTNASWLPGSSGSDVLVQVAYTRAVFTPLAANFIGSNGNQLLLSTFAFQNEPY